MLFAFSLSQIVLSMGRNFCLKNNTIRHSAVYRQRLLLHKSYTRGMGVKLAHFIAWDVLFLASLYIVFKGKQPFVNTMCITMAESSHKFLTLL